MKNVIKKEPVAKAPKALKPKIELVTYSMRMVIPTGQYANVQPEIVVKGGSIEEAHDFIAPHMNKLWKEYYLISERRPAPAAPAKAPDIAPASDVAYLKAHQAIQSCMSQEALNLIAHQVSVSTKLAQADKELLIPAISKKSDELHAAK